MRVVLDTNVLVSAPLFSGVTSRLISLWQRGSITVLLSRDILEEYLRVLSYPKFELSEAEIKDLMEEELLPYVTNIAAALESTKKTKAVLLENHGVLAFGADPAAAARANLIVEETAQMAIFAEVLGGAKLIPPEMLKATIGRRDDFARAGAKQSDQAP